MRSEERRKEKRTGEGLVEGKEQRKIKDGLIYSKKYLHHLLDKKWHIQHYCR